MRLAVAIISLLFFLLTFTSSVEAKSFYGSFRAPSYRAPSVRNYSPPAYKAPSAPKNYQNGGQLYMQKGYIKGNGTYVQPHLKTKPDNSLYNNRKQRLGY